MIAIHAVVEKFDVFHGKNGMGNGVDFFSVFPFAEIGDAFNDFHNISGLINNHLRQFNACEPSPKHCSRIDADLVSVNVG